MLILSLRGKSNSAFAQADAIGTHPLKHFVSVDGETGLSTFSGHGILCDSVLRFKGCQAAVVFIVDTQTDAWTTTFARRLYCAMTRSVGRLELFLDYQTDAIITQRLSFAS